MDALVLTIPEAACAIGVSARTYYAAAARGEVPAIRIGRRLVVPEAALHRFLESGVVTRQSGVTS